MKLKDSLLVDVYLNQNKTNGIELDDKTAKKKIYAQYVEAFKKGAYNYIKEDYDAETQKIIPRKYFSGGLTRPKDVVDQAMLPAGYFIEFNRNPDVFVNVNGVPLNGEISDSRNKDFAMLSEQQAKEEYRRKLEPYSFLYFESLGRSVQNFLRKSGVIDDFVKIFEADRSAYGKRNQTGFLALSLPEFLSGTPSWLQEGSYWSDIVELAELSADYRRLFSAFQELADESKYKEIKLYWPDIVKLAKVKKKYNDRVIRSVLRFRLYLSEEEYKSYWGDLKRRYCQMLASGYSVKPNF
jgi:hypothetical protein